MEWLAEYIITKRLFLHSLSRFQTLKGRGGGRDFFPQMYSQPKLFQMPPRKKNIRGCRTPGGIHSILFHLFKQNRQPSVIIYFREHHILVSILLDASYGEFVLSLNIIWLYTV